MEDCRRQAVRSRSRRCHGEIAATRSIRASATRCEHKNWPASSGWKRATRSHPNRRGQAPLEPSLPKSPPAGLGAWRLVEARPVYASAGHRAPRARRSRAVARNSTGRTDRRSTRNVWGPEPDPLTRRNPGARPGPRPGRRAESLRLEPRRAPVAAWACPAPPRTD